RSSEERTGTSRRATGEICAATGSACVAPVAANAVPSRTNAARFTAHPSAHARGSLRSGSSARCPSFPRQTGVAMIGEEPPKMRPPEAAERDFIVRALRAGDVGEPHANDVADVLVAADLRGVESHGIARL